MRKIVILFFVMLSIKQFSQSIPNKFSQLPIPIKKWIIFHPFKAKKAQLVSTEANRVSDSIKKSILLDGDAAGGQVDAFRHGYWMARLKQEIGENAARRLGKAYEKANKLYFKNNKLEEGILPDKPSKKMDLYNNEIGLSLVSKNNKILNSGLIYRVVNAILSGKFTIIKKDQKGNFLTCNSQIISSSEIQQKWDTKKCLIPSNQTFE